MKLLILTAYFLLLGQVAWTQSLTLEGNVSAEKNSEFIPYAHIYVEGTSFGTVSNSDGNFIFNVPRQFENYNIVFSCLGFQSVKFPVKELSEAGFKTIKLKNSVTMLDGVVVSTVGAESIWKKAVKKHIQRSTTPDYKMSAFYRTTFQEDGYFSRLLEAAVNLHGGGGPHNRAKIEFVQIRKSLDLRKNIWQINDGYLNHLAHHHPVRRKLDILNKWSLRKYDIEIRDYIYQDDDLYYVFKAKGPAKGMHDVEMVVRERDLSIFKITIFWKPENAGDFSWAWEDREEEKFFCDWQESNYHYQEYEGKMYLKHASWHRKGRVINKESEETVFATESIDELLVTNIELGKFEMKNVIPGEVLNIYDMADYFEYDSDFWKNYNRPADSEYFKNAKSKMEAHIPLETQFIQSGEEKLVSNKNEN